MPNGRLPRATSRYIRSANVTRFFLKPFVFTFARLFEIVSTLSCWAFMPVAAIYRESSICVPSLCSVSEFAERADCPIEHAVVALDQLLARLEVAHRVDDADHLVQRDDIGILEIALPHADSGHLRGIGRRRRVQAVADLLHQLRMGKVDDAQLADRLVVLEYAALAVDARLCRRQRDVAGERNTVGRDEPAAGVDL